MKKCRNLVLAPSIGMALFLGACLLISAPAEAQMQSSISGLPEDGIPGPGQNNLYDQTNACSDGVASQQFPDFGDSRLQAADDFTVPAGATWTLERVYNQGLFSVAGPFDSVIVEIYDNTGPGGLPGGLYCQETGLTSAGGTSDPNLDVTLDGSCVVGEGTWWVSVLTDQDFGVAGQWFWAQNASNNGSEYAFQDPDGLVGTSCPSWGLGSTTCGVGLASDLCVGIDGTVGVPVPSMPVLGLVTLLAALLLVGLMMTRRLTTG